MSSVSASDDIVRKGAITKNEGATVDRQRSRATAHERVVVVTAFTAIGAGPAVSTITRDRLVAGELTVRDRCLGTSIDVDGSGEARTAVATGDSVRSIRPSPADCLVTGKSAAGNTQCRWTRARQIEIAEIDGTTCGIPCMLAGTFRSVTTLGKIVLRNGCS